MSANEGARSFVRVSKVTSGWTWMVQVIDDTTMEELREAMEKALQLNDELFDRLYPQPEPEF
jgi:hypothetical protein